MSAPRSFPRVNFVALLSAALSLTSLFLSWWGISTTGFLAESFTWSLWSGPSRLYAGSTNSAQTLTTYSPLVGILVIASIVLILLGMLPRASKLMIGSIVFGVVALVLYPIIVSEAVSNACKGVSNCISGPFGTETVSGGPFTLTVSWGFQPGFYIQMVAVILSVIAIAFQRTYLSTNTT